MMAQHGHAPMPAQQVVMAPTNQQQVDIFLLTSYH
jgi:hypothetical protein